MMTVGFSIAYDPVHRTQARVTIGNQRWVLLMGPDSFHCESTARILYHWCSQLPWVCEMPKASELKIVPPRWWVPVLGCHGGSACEKHRDGSGNWNCRCLHVSKNHSQYKMSQEGHKTRSVFVELTNHQTFQTRENTFLYNF